MRIRAASFIPVRLTAWVVLGLWFVLQWVYSAGYAASGAGSVAYMAHIFGFLAEQRACCQLCRWPVERPVIVDGYLCFRVSRNGCR
jgi:hypothetical protein